MIDLYKPAQHPPELVKMNAEARAFLKTAPGCVRWRIGVVDTGLGRRVYRARVWAGKVKHLDVTYSSRHAAETAIDVVSERLLRESVA